MVIDLPEGIETRLRGAAERSLEQVRAGEPTIRLVEIAAENGLAD